MLYAGADAAAFVVQHRCRRARTVVRHPRDGIEADPLTRWRTLEMDGDVRVDEQKALEGQNRTHTVAVVRGSDSALHRRGCLARDDRLAQANPRERCAGFQPATTRVAHFAAMSV